MGDTGDDYRAFDEYKREQKSNRLKENMEVFYDSEYNFPRRWTEGDNPVLRLRFTHVKAGRTIKTIFYPTTNVWVTENRRKTGDAKAFLNWLSKQS